MYLTQRMRYIGIRTGYITDGKLHDLRRLQSLIDHEPNVTSACVDRLSRCAADDAFCARVRHAPAVQLWAPATEPGRVCCVKGLRSRDREFLRMQCHCNAQLR